MKWIDVCIFIMLLFIPEPLWSVNSYPEWFLYPYKYPNITTGYSYNGLSAKEDVVSMLTAYSDCVVNGHLEVFEYPGRDDVLKNSEYYYWFSEQSADNLRSRIIPLQRYDIDLLTKDYIQAFSMDSIKLDSVPLVDIQTLKRPWWIEKFCFESDQYYYGVGMYTSQGRENDAWKTAEEQAVFSILTHVAVRFHNIVILKKTSSPQEGFTKISFLELRFHLENIHILERYPDWKNQLYYVLVRIHKSNIHSPLLKQ
ncbi:MAG: hypothetical protein U5R06_05515 [candidate division KSB1 bacterium]|nr:hypothetical protein [candidate division KSB1 bacterium]